MGKTSNADLRKELEALKAENAKLKAKNSGPLKLKVSAKGGVSLYGLQRFPVTLYRAQWERILGAEEDIRAFIKAHKDELSEKDD